MTVSAELAEWLAGKAKARPRGVLPPLPPREAAIEIHEQWLTMATRPPRGWRVAGFERHSQEKTSSCSLTVRNGREGETFRFESLKDLMSTPRSVLAVVTNGFLDMPHLGGPEIEDFGVALCRYGDVLTNWDERDTTRKWVEGVLAATLPFTGHTLVPDGRFKALMAVRGNGEFLRSDAEVLRHPGEDQRWIQRPMRFVDSETGEQWLRARETVTYIRYLLHDGPLSQPTLTGRLREIGIECRLFEDRRGSVHPKLYFYRLTDEFIAERQT
jgi:hypothetical protein